MSFRGFTLDAGALIAIDRDDRRVARFLKRAREEELEIVVPAGVVGQVWRDGRRQAQLAKLLGGRTVQIEPLDHYRARAAGQLCGACGTDDVIDASVVLCARMRKHQILTGDVDDLLRLDPKAEVIDINSLK
jgi:hypothetical protein